MVGYLLLIIILVVVLAMYWKSAIMGDMEQMVVKYGGVNIGTGETPRLTKERTAKMPYIQFDEAANDKFYTLTLTDTSAPHVDHPDPGPWRHWLLVDIPGDKLKKGSPNIEGAGGSILTHHIGPQPPEGSGSHVYDVTLFEQSNGRLVGPQVRPARRNWDLDRFLEKHPLREVSKKSFKVKQ